MDETFYAVVRMIKDGDGNWHRTMSEEVFTTYEEADDDRRYQFSEFDREVNDAFTYVIEFKGV